ncbi:MAG: SIS domain-containing protein [Acidobacteriota bacterium]
MSHAAFVDRYLESLRQATHGLDPEAISAAIAWFAEARATGRTIFAAGNGGSSTIASNLVVDLMKCASLGDGDRFRAIHLGDSLSTLTAYANDEGYATVFAEPLRNLAGEGDLLVAISGSGESPNVLAAVAVARDLGCRSIALTSRDQGQLRSIADLGLLVPSTHMGRLEDCFFVLTHALTYPFIEAAAGSMGSA